MAAQFALILISLARTKNTSGAATQLARASLWRRLAHVDLKNERLERARARPSAISTASGFSRQTVVHAASESAIYASARAWGRVTSRRRATGIGRAT